MAVNPFTGEVLVSTPGINRPELQTQSRAQTKLEFDRMNREKAAQEAASKQVEQDAANKEIAQQALDTLKTGGKVEFSKTQQGLQIAMQQKQGEINGSNSSGVLSGVSNRDNSADNRVNMDNKNNLQPIEIQNTVQEYKYKNPIEKGLTNAQTQVDYYRLKNPLAAGALGFGVGFANSAYQGGKFVYSAVTSPIKTIKETSIGIYEAVKSPMTTVQNIKESAEERPGEFIGGVAFDVVSGKAILSASNKATLAARSATAPLRAGFEYVPIESIADAKVLAGEKFPTSPSPQAALREFKELGTQPDTTLLSTNARPVGLPNVITAGEKGISATEDAVLYTAPYTRGSPLFLRTSGTSYEGITLNPFKVANPFAADPAFNIIQSKGIKELPRDVIESASGGDFTKVNKYLANNADKSYIYQTARSANRFTSEAEAGVASGTKAIVNKPFAYTKYDGNNIPVRLVDITGEQVSRSTSTLKAVNKQTLGDVYYSSSGRTSKYTPIVSPSVNYKQLSSGSTGSSIKSIRPTSSSTTSSSQLSSTSVNAVSNSAASISYVKPSSSFGTSSISATSSVSNKSSSSVSGGSTPQNSSVGFPSRGNPFVGRPPSGIMQHRKDKKKKFNLGYSAYVRKKGKFQRIATGLAREQAIYAGASDVRTTAAATFQVRQEGFTQNEDRGLFNNMRDFVQKKADTFIQKAAKRISSQGEKQQITFKGIAARRMSRGIK
jgi:hypothetical protein